MGLLDKIADLLGLGPNSWDERLRGTIDFISPEGNEFSALWIGDPRSKDKKLGIFTFPKVRGTVVQDLGTNSADYPLSFWFDGKDNDKTAKSFFAACDQEGQWEVTHPLYGFFSLQLVSVTQNIFPVTEGNVTRFDTTWIEPIDPDTLKTGREEAGIIDGQGGKTKLNALEQFAEKVKQGTQALKDGIAQTTQLIENASERTLGPLASIVDSVDDAFNAIQDGINDTLNATVLQVESLAGEIQALIETPLLASNSIQSRLDTYDDLTQEFLSVLPSDDRSEVAINKTAVAELALTSNVVAFSQIAITGVFTPAAPPSPPGTAPAPSPAPPVASRAQAIQTAQRISDLFTLITDSLDNVQTDFAENDIDQQYFSQSSSYASSALLIGQTVRFLLIQAYDLRIEKRFTLETAKTPAQIVIEEYGSLGDGDENLDLFISSNGLKGKDILYLPAGREVVTYV